MQTTDIGWVLVVAEEGNLTRAAERVHVSPPTLSEAVRRVERSLGATLFIRSNRGMSLTREGEEALPRLRAVVRAIEELHAATDGRTGNQSVSVRVGTLFGYGANKLHELIADPPVVDEQEIGVEILVGDWSDPTAGLRSGNAGCAILVGPTTIDSELESIVLAMEDRYAIFDAAHPLASRKSVTLAEVDEVGWLPLGRFAGDEKWSRYWLGEDVRGGPPPPSRWGPVRNPEEVAVGLHSGKGTMTSIRSVAEHFRFGTEVPVIVEDLPPCPVRLCYRRDNEPPGFALLANKLMEGESLGFNARAGPGAVRDRNVGS